VKDQEWGSISSWVVRGHSMKPSIMLWIWSLQKW
jgi:hypothetical protein